MIVDEKAREHLTHQAGGDGRNLLNALELAVETTPTDSDGTIHITLEVAQESIQKRALLYDRMGDEHYDTISAFIKSVRGSDPDGVWVRNAQDHSRKKHAPLFLTCIFSNI